MAISGHRPRSIFDRYDIVNDRDKREALTRTQEAPRRGRNEPRGAHPQTGRIMRTITEPSQSMRLVSGMLGQRRLARRYGFSSD